MEHKQTNEIAEHGLKYMMLNFIKSDAFSGILLLCCALVAMLVANSPLKDMYFALWHYEIGFSYGDGNTANLSLHAWINDALMAIFFLLVGLEIKREFLFGELKGFKKAAFPVIAAAGGMIAPGLFYTFFNYGTEAASGFGIPMATDIAFALGVILLLGKRVPVALKVFLVTLAVADDLGAIIVIAIFYTTGLKMAYLMAAVAIIGFLAFLNSRGVRSLVPYLVMGIFLWLAVHSSGIHATIAAVALAFTIPASSSFSRETFTQDLNRFFDSFKGSRTTTESLQHGNIDALDDVVHSYNAIQSPLAKLEHTIHPWSGYFIMPLFAFANAGVTIGDGIDFSSNNVLPGILCGLVLGKPIGILLATFLSEKLGIASRPSGISWIKIFGAGMLAGIGFTMSIFVTNLAFTNPALTDVAKIAILIASGTAGIIGSLFLILESKISSKTK